jgi:hypothetical protein
METLSWTVHALSVLNLNEDERPGGIKVRIKIRVESGKKGRARDARQGEALKEYLKWVVQQEQQDEAGRQ